MIELHSGFKKFKNEIIKEDKKIMVSITNDVNHVNDDDNLFLINLRNQVIQIIQVRNYHDYFFIISYIFGIVIGLILGFTYRNL